MEDACRPEGGSVNGYRAEAIAFLDSADLSKRNAIKDVIEDINENRNTAGPCSPEPEEGEDTVDDQPGGTTCDQASPGTQITICHIPPGDPDAKHTITIDAAAWPAHKSHGDTCGPCK